MRGTLWSDSVGLQLGRGTGLCTPRSPWEQSQNSVVRLREYSHLMLARDLLVAPAMES